MTRIPVTTSVYGEGNSVKMVTEVGKLSQELTEEQEKERSIVDGFPSVKHFIVMTWRNWRCFMPLPKKSMQQQ